MPIESCAGEGSGRAAKRMAAINAGSDLKMRMTFPFLGAEGLSIIT
jgi:hypothetical protein